MSTNESRSRDESEYFTLQEFEAAFRHIASANDAKRQAREMIAGRALDDNGPPWQLAPDILDLLSLVSDSCAERVREILNISVEEARERRVRASTRFQSHE